MPKQPVQLSLVTAEIDVVPKAGGPRGRVHPGLPRIHLPRMHIENKRLAFAFSALSGVYDSYFAVYDIAAVS